MSTKIRKIEIIEDTEKRNIRITEKVALAFVILEGRLFSTEKQDTEEMEEVYDQW